MTRLNSSPNRIINKARHAAMAAGERYYEAAFPCKKNPKHSNIRFTRNGACCECTHEYERDRWRKDREMREKAGLRVRKQRGPSENGKAAQERRAAVARGVRIADRVEPVPTWGTTYPALMGLK